MMALYVQRDAAGAIVGLVQRTLTPDEVSTGLWQPASGEDSDVQAFARRLGQDDVNPLAETDASLARVVEDLIDILIDKSLIQFTDLPAAAQNKLLERRQTRSRLTNRLNLLGDSDII